jgi:hypothetical protein
MNSHSLPAVAAGEIIAYRLFDIAYAVDLYRAEELLQQSRGPRSARIRLTATPAKAVDYDVPPILLTLDPIALDIARKTYSVGVTVRIYDFGVATIALSVPVADLQWNAFSNLLNAVNQIIGPGSGHPVWGDLTKEIRRLLAGALDRPGDNVLEEDYLIGRVRAFDRPMTGQEIQTQLDLVPLLSGEVLTLSDGARDDLLRQKFSYYTDDFVVLTWDRAFIYDPRGDSDVIDVLEVANAQLLEMRYYDELLDDELPRMYDLVESTRRAHNPLSSRRYAHLARRLYTLVAEVTELTEKVDNALQVTEDVYLARIYTAALDLFRVRVVSAAVDRKLAIIRDTYAALYDEASGARAALMELAILLLIVIEVVLAVAHV